MKQQKHFIDTSVLRPLISSSEKTKKYYDEKLKGKIYYCSYVKMEFIRGYIFPCIDFYFVLKMPNIESLSDALSFWSQKFQTRDLKAVLSMFSGLLRKHDYDFDSNTDKEEAAIKVADYIRRIVGYLPHRFTDTGHEKKLCSKIYNVELNFDANDIEKSFVNYRLEFQKGNATNCEFNKFINKHKLEIELQIKNKSINIADSQSSGFKKIIEKLESDYTINCTTCKQISDFIISLLSPKEMQLEHTDYSFDYLMEILDKPHYRHPAEMKIIRP